MFPTEGLSPKDIRQNSDRAKARLWLDAAGEALAKGLARMPDSVPLRLLLERFRREVGRRA